MGFRFRKSIKIAPGLRMNVGKSGLSMSAGVRGASVSVGKRGAHGNVGVPGTGLSYRKRLDSSSSGAYSAQRDVIDNDVIDAVSVTMSIDEKGAVTAKRPSGEPLSAAETKLAWEQQGEALSAWLLREIDDINGDVEALCGIHKDTPDPTSEPRYQEIKFAEPPPQMPDEPVMPLEPLEPKWSSVPLTARLVKSKRKKFEYEQEEIQQVFKFEHAAWQSDVRNTQLEHQKSMDAWQIERVEWMKRYKAHAADEKRREENFRQLIRTDLEAMQRSLDSSLQALGWPRETLVSYELREEGKEVWIDVDLPEIEDMPSRVAALAASGKRLNIKNKAQKNLRSEYATHIHGIAFRIAGTVMACLPSAELVVVSGYSQRLDPATGIENDDYLFSVKYARNGFDQINFGSLEKVDPIAVLENFENVRKMTKTGIFKPIEPFAP